MVSFQVEVLFYLQPLAKEGMQAEVVLYANIPKEHLRFHLSLIIMCNQKDSPIVYVNPIAYAGRESIEKKKKKDMAGEWPLTSLSKIQIALLLRLGLPGYLRTNYLQLGARVHSRILLSSWRDVKPFRAIQFNFCRLSLQLSATHITCFSQCLNSSLSILHTVLGKCTPSWCEKPGVSWAQYCRLVFVCSVKMQGFYIYERSCMCLKLCSGSILKRQKHAFQFFLGKAWFLAISFCEFHLFSPSEISSYRRQHQNEAWKMVLET